MLKKLKSSIFKLNLSSRATVFLLFTVFILFGSLNIASAAKVCDNVTANYCVEFTAVDPAKPTAGTDFTAKATVSVQNVSQSLRGQAINFAIRWKVNPSSIADFLNNLVGETQITLTPDNNGNASTEVTQVFNITNAGSAGVGVKMEVTRAGVSSGPQAYDVKQVTIASRQSSQTDTVEINNIVSSSSSDTTGRKITFTASYVPAGQTTPSTASDFSVQWDFGDGKTSNTNPVDHLYDKTGNYTVKVTVLKNGSVVAENTKVVSVSGNPTEPGDMSPIATLINQILGIIIGFLQELIYGIFYWLIAPVIQAMLSIRVYTDAFVAVIYPGWEVIRNICNIFFIVALIVIALATLFRVESYKARPLLIQLILAALMINFSLVIAQAILALADTVQAQFLPANVTVIRSLAGDLMVGTYRDLYGSKAFADGTWSGVVKPLFFLAMSLGSFAVFCAIAIFLVIRIVALWLLLLISPIAYAAGVLPATAQYRKQWWDNFIKYAFFTPIMAFFLNLTAVISNQFKENSILQTVSDPRLVAELGNSDLASFVFRVASNVLLLVFLIASLKVADMAGIYGASGITSIAQKGIFAPFAVAGKLSKVAAERSFEGVQNVTGVTLDPRIWASKWKDYSEREKHKRLEARAEQDIGIGSFRIQGSAGMGLGNPMDFYKNYINWAGVKRIGRNLKSKYQDVLEEKNKAFENLQFLRTKAGILSNSEYQNLLDELQKQEVTLTNKQNDKIALENEKVTLDTDGNLVQDSLKKLRNDFKNATSQKDKDNIAKEIQVVEGTLNDLNNRKAANKEAFIKNIAELEQSNKDVEDLKKKIEANDERVRQVRQIEDSFDYSKFDDAEKSSLEAQVIKALEQFSILESEAAARKRPEAYHARAARLHLEHEEEQKVEAIKNWPEKVQIFRAAQSEGNAFLASAVVKSLAKDSNFNEILGAFGYSVSADGMREFFEKEFKQKLGTTNHHMMEVATEVGYHNEDSGWWNMARVSAVDNHGHQTWAVSEKWLKNKAKQLGYNPDKLSHSQKEEIINIKPVSENEYNEKWGPQLNEVSVEMKKRGARTIVQNFARTSFVNQEIGPTGWQSSMVHDAGWNVIKALDTAGQRNEVGRMLRPNTAEAIVAAPNWSPQEAVNRGISQELFNLINSVAHKPAVKVWPKSTNR